MQTPVITNIKGGFTLRKGLYVPYLGLVTYLQYNHNEAAETVKAAFNVGYRYIDAVSVYENENGIGTGIKESRVLREAVFIVSKVWNADQGYDATLRSF